MKPEPQIVYADSYLIIGHYLAKFHRIELSLYIKDFPYLHNAVVEHELSHSKATSLLTHFWIDTRDTCLNMLDPEFVDQLIKFCSLGDMKGFKYGAFRFCYGLFTIVRAFLQLLMLPTLVYLCIKKRKK